MTSECERFELEIGMRQHGALDAKETAQLEKHLTTCDGCRAFATTGGGFDAALQRQVEAEAGAIDWRALDSGVARLRRNHRLKLWLAPLFVLQLPLIFFLGLGHAPPRELLWAAPLTPLLFAAYVWLVNRPFRALLSAARRTDDLVAGYVRELRRRQLRARIFATITFLLAITCVVQAFVFPDMRLFELASALLFSSWSAYDLTRTLPRLRRALAEAA